MRRAGADGGRACKGASAICLLERALWHLFCRRQFARAGGRAAPRGGAACGRHRRALQLVRPADQGAQGPGARRAAPLRAHCARGRPRAPELCARSGARRGGPRHAGPAVGTAGDPGRAGRHLDGPRRSHQLQRVPDARAPPTVRLRGEHRLQHRPLLGLGGGELATVARAAPPCGLRGGVLPRAARRRHRPRQVGWRLRP
mmetsp:Transcript_44679/g.138985  ORF Transcript_44679/g.138985 Transcript_44679/m.138985 type:complete len:201 (+) Transcript_44679:169-771(+)